MADYFCSQSGAGVQDGTLAAPWSIADLSSNWATISGNTLYVLGAVTSRITIQATSISGSYTNVRGDYPGQECTITSEVNKYAINVNSSSPVYSHINISGFTISGQSDQYYYINIQGTTAQYINVYNNVLNGTSEGIRLEQGPSYCSIYNNIINIDTPFTGAGIQLYQVQNCNIYGNTIQGDTTNPLFITGIQLRDATTTNNNIYNNFITNFNGDGIMLRTKCNNNNVYANIVGPGVRDCIAIEDASYNNVFNNTVIQDGVYGTTFPTIKLGSYFGAGVGSDYNVIQNNILVSDVATSNVPGQFGNSTYPMGANNTISYNLWWNNSTAEYADQIRVTDGTLDQTYSIAEYLALGNYGAGAMPVFPEGASPLLSIKQRLIMLPLLEGVTSGVPKINPCSPS